MIITTVAHGRTPRDTRALLGHLEQQEGQRSRVVAVDWSPADDARGALRAMQLLRDGSRAEVAFHHLTVSPRNRLTPEQRDVVVNRICRALGADEHARIVWEHDGKPRAGAEVDHHFHVVLGHVGPTLRALDMGHSYARLEAVARGIEHDLGEVLTPSRRSRSVAARLRASGRENVAQAVEAAAPIELPRSATSSRARARADRQGSQSPQEARQAVQAAWVASDSGTALRAALAASGLVVERGRKPGVWVVTQAGLPLGALDRLARVPGAVVEARMREPLQQRAVPLADRLEALERKHQDALDRLDDALPAEPAQCATLRTAVARAREASHSALVAWRESPPTSTLGPRPTGILAALRGNSARWDTCLSELQALKSDLRSAWLGLSDAEDAHKARLVDAEKAHRRAVAKVREEQRPAREVEEAVLAWVKDARVALAETPDKVAQRGLREAVEAMRAERERSRSRDGPSWSL